MIGERTAGRNSTTRTKNPSCQHQSALINQSIGNVRSVCLAENEENGDPAKSGKPPNLMGVDYWTSWRLVDAAKVQIITGAVLSVLMRPGFDQYDDELNAHKGAYDLHD